MLKCGYLVEWWVFNDGDSCWGVELCSLYMFFRVFQTILLANMCFNITVGPNNITLGCCGNGTRYLSRNLVHWSCLRHPECNINNCTAVVNSLEDGGDGWDWDVILLLVFLLLFLLFGIVGMWRRRRMGRCVGRRREREESEDQEDEGGVEMEEMDGLTNYLYLFI